MKLLEWLRMPNPDGTPRRKYKLAEAIGVHPTMVTGYADGSIMPTRKTMAAIIKVTGGQVTPNDFFERELHGAAE